MSKTTKHETAIRVDWQVHELLCRRSGAMQKQFSRKVSLNEALRSLIGLGPEVGLPNYEIRDDLSLAALRRIQSLVVTANRVSVAFEETTLGDELESCFGRLLAVCEHVLLGVDMLH